MPDSKNKSIPTKFPKLLFGTILILRLAIRTFAQGTIQFGFEDFPTGATPPYVTLNRFTGYAFVADSSSAPYIIPPFEGQHFFSAAGSIFISSPDGQPIQSFSFDIFVPKPRFGFLGTLRIADQPQAYVLDRWQEIHGSLAVPAQSVEISLIDSSEAVARSFAIDAVKFTTIPEPKTFWIFTIGLTAIIFLPRWNRMKSPASQK